MHDRIQRPPRATEAATTGAGHDGRMLPVVDAAIAVHILDRTSSGAASAWELHLSPAPLHELAAWLNLPALTRAWALPEWPLQQGQALDWSALCDPTGEVLDHPPRASDPEPPEPLLLDPLAALDCADRVAISVQDGRHAVLWTRELPLVLAATRAFVQARTDARPHPALLAELTDPVPLGHAFRLHASSAGPLSIELVGSPKAYRAAWWRARRGVLRPEGASQTAG